MAKRFPLIAQNLFEITTLDYIIYGTGVGCIPIMTKMCENHDPIVALESDIIDKYKIYFRTYELSKQNTYFIYSNPEYSNNNFIEFFNNIDYLDLLATTKVGFKQNETNRIDTKPAYLYDIEHLKKIGFHKDYIKRWFKRFHQKEKEYKHFEKKRCGIIMN